MCLDARLQLLSSSAAQLSSRVFRPAPAVFHEGLKSWSCCPTTNRAVTSFDDFLNLPGCATGTHSSEAPVAPPKPVVPPTPTPTTTNAEGKEVYGAAAAAPLPPPPVRAATPLADAAKPASTAYVEEQDDPEVVVEKGTVCKRKACGMRFDGEDREGEECRYHAGAVSCSWYRKLPTPKADLLHTAHLPRRIQGLLVLQASGTGL